VTKFTREIPMSKYKSRLLILAGKKTMYKQCRYNTHTTLTVEVLLTLLVSNSPFQYWGLILAEQ